MPQSLTKWDWVRADSEFGTEPADLAIQFHPLHQSIRMIDLSAFCWFPDDMLARMHVLLI